MRGGCPVGMGMKERERGIDFRYEAVAAAVYSTRLRRSADAAAALLLLLFPQQKSGTTGSSLVIVIKDPAIRRTELLEATKIYCRTAAAATLIIIQLQLCYHCAVKVVL